MPRFDPPVAYTLPRVTSRTRGVELAHFRHYSPLPVGQSVLKIGGVYRTVQGPTQSQIDSATEVYLGGHIYDVSDAVAAALVAAGYTVAAEVDVYPSEELFPSPRTFVRN